MRKVFLMMLLATVFIVGCGEKANDGNVIKIGVIGTVYWELCTIWSSGKRRCGTEG